MKVERVTRLQTTWIDRLRGRSAESPKLPVDASKLGGVPYLESEDAWPRDRKGERLPFIGQLNFSELPPILSAAPRRGIFVLFADDSEPYCACRWYPEPQGNPSYRTSNPSKLAIAGPFAGAWECRLRAAPAVTVSFASWCEDERFFDTDDAVPLREWAAEQGGRVGAFTDATLPSPSPRDWFGPEPADGADWLQVWEECLGSMTHSVVVRLEDFEAGRLDRCRVVAWQ